MGGGEGRPPPGAPRQLREVIAQADAGDAGCRSVVADAGRALGVAIVGACDLPAPQRVVVGRELARAGDLLLDPLRACVRRSAIAASREAPVLAGVLGGRAEVLGAVALVLRASQRFVAEPPAVV